MEACRGAVQEFKLWLSRIPNSEPIMKTDRFERGSYMVFDTTSWDCVRKVTLLSKRPSQPSQPRP